MLIALGSVKGSPGATTMAVALAVRWPQSWPRPVLLELDPAGGDLGSRWRAHDEPGLLGMAVAAQSAPLGDGTDWMQYLSVGAHVVIGPTGDAAAAAVADLASRSLNAIKELAAVRPVIADLGRLDPHSPALSYLDVADELLLVAAFRMEGLRHLRARIEMLTKRCPVRLILVGRAATTVGEVCDYLRVPVAAVVRDDPAGADILAGRASQTAGWTRRPILAAARSIALAHYEAQPAAAQVAS